MQAILIACLLEMLASISNASKSIVGPRGGQRRGAAVPGRATHGPTTHGEAALCSSTTLCAITCTHQLHCTGACATLARMSCKNVLQECVARMCCKNVLQECVARMRCKSCNSHATAAARAIDLLGAHSPAAPQGSQKCAGKKRFMLIRNPSI